MKFTCLLLMLATGLPAQSPLSMKAVRLEHLLVLEDVFLNGVGPFRMAVDTGNASSLIRPSVARRIGARPSYAVEQVTAAGSRRLPVVLLDRVTVGALTEQTVEAMVGDVHLAKLDGVLGQSWLVRHDYLLDYRNNRLVLNGAPPDRGLDFPLHSVDGRPLLSAEVDGKRSELMLDSGASTVVLFECAAGRNLTATLLTNSSSVQAAEVTTRISLPGDGARKLPALCVGPSRHAPGLLPAGIFSSAFVSNSHGFLRLTRR